MKQLCIVLMLLTIIGLKAQSAVGLAVYQDPKLALFEDGHSNNPYTFDMTFKVKLQGYQKSIGYLSINTKYRYANLIRIEELVENDITGYLSRYGVEGQYIFNTIINKIGLAPTLGYGILRRSNTPSMSSWEFGGEVTYYLGKGFKGTIESIWMQRPDLINKDFVFNLSLGIQFDIDVDYLGKDEGFKRSREL